MTPATSALIAATRFGYVAKEGELATIAQDPRGWALQQLKAPPPPLPGDLPNSAQMVIATFEAQKARKDQDPAGRKDFNQQMRDAYLGDVEARMAAAATSDAPLLERLTHFWSNHFTVSAMRPVIRGFAGAFEREAIRPHVTGRFADMLMAAESHPAMLLYLDNAQSIGPDSVAGQRRGKGLNENLGREILELHTLGVDGGYTQDDVEALARILTGWSIGRLNDQAAQNRPFARAMGSLFNRNENFPQIMRPDAEGSPRMRSYNGAMAGGGPDGGPGKFKFYEVTHEPGPKTLLGKRYEEAGYQEGVAALHDIARNKATAHHIAVKLARHFIADDPPKDAVERIARVFRDSDGNLARVTEAVINEEAVWETPYAKLRTPTDLVIAATRVSGFTMPAPMMTASLKSMDQQPFFAQQPSGWPDDSASWAAPEAVLRRAQWCEAFAQRAPDMPDPNAIVEASFGEGASDATRDAIKLAPSRQVGLAILLASPEFQRR